MLTHELDHGVLVITMEREPDVQDRATLVTEIGDLARGYRPAPVVIALDGPEAGAAAAGVVLRAHRLCRRLGILMSVTARSAPVRRALETHAALSGVHLVINARADIAIAAAAFANAA
ncbi:MULTISPECIES: hypothetical protein [unclassified Streptomyces]|uniref:hypothetical protein n=1 Tax=unclassified Streptomyces TaxID=2593676 RepID=UPI0008DD0714|nr:MULTISPECIES: hypothetical protein [unclassified Streptomyces]OII70085.1 hypothetical protein BJP39_14955 [Streptomyces sp. CC77]